MKCPYCGGEYLFPRTAESLAASEIMRQRVTELESQNAELVEAMEELIQVNEEWNAAVEGLIGRPVGWNANYLNKAKALLNRLKES